MLLSSTFFCMRAPQQRRSRGSRGLAARPLAIMTDVAFGRVEDGRGSLGPYGQRPVSHPRSSNRACRFPAPGFPTGFTARHTTAGRSLLVSGDDTSARDGLRQAVELSLKAPDFIRRCQAHHQSPSPHHLQKRTRSRGPLLRRHYPASTLLLPRPTPAVTTA